MNRTKAMRTVALVGAMAMVALGVACGDDKESEGISKSDYLFQAKAICQKGNKALTAASNDVFAKLAPGQKLSEPEIDDFVRKTVLPTIRDQVSQLRALPPPKGEKGHVEEIYKALDKGLDELDKSPKKLSDGSNVFADADKLANKYGISVCATTG